MNLNFKLNVIFLKENKSSALNIDINDTKPKMKIIHSQFLHKIKTHKLAQTD